jgi:hypothetical protein
MSLVEVEVDLDLVHGDSCSSLSEIERTRACERKSLREEELARGKSCERNRLGKERLAGRRRFDFILK